MGKNNIDASLIARLNDLATQAGDREGSIFVWLVDVPASRELASNIPENVELICVSRYRHIADGWHTLDCPAYAGFDAAQAALPAPTGIILYSARQTAAAAAQLATAVGCLGDGGHLTAFAPNTAGGKRLPGLVRRMGLDVTTTGRHRCTFVSARGYGTTIDHRARDAMIAQGRIRENDAGYYAAPGLHSWQRADAGSAMLAAHLPDKLNGNGADLGCGWGYLSVMLIPAMQAGRSLYLADNDKYALDAAQMNITARAEAYNISCQMCWCDLRSCQDMPDSLDWIAMNPPFHDGATTDPGLGRAFIACAARCLKPDGRLFMVANRKLAYENDLQAYFSHVDKLLEADGYKIFYARK